MMTYTFSLFTSFAKKRSWKRRDRERDTHINIERMKETKTKKKLEKRLYIEWKRHSQKEWKRLMRERITEWQVEDINRETGKIKRWMIFHIGRLLYFYLESKFQYKILWLSLKNVVKLGLALSVTVSEISLGWFIVRHFQFILCIFFLAIYKKQKYLTVYTIFKIIF